MKPLSLGVLSLEQLDAVVELDYRCLGGLWTKTGYQREVESPNSDLLMLWSGDRPLALGCLWAIVEEGHITVLGVDPDLRGQRLGQLLLCVLLRGAYQRGLQWATLEVRASNQAALNLYQKLGFESVGERRNYYPDGENAQILWNKGLRKPDYLTQLTHHYAQAYEGLKRTQWDLENILSPQVFLKPTGKS